LFLPTSPFPLPCAWRRPPNQLKTLDEYLQSKPKPEFELPAARRPNEGVDDSQWKDAVPLEKEEEELFGDIKKSAGGKSKKQKERKEVVTIDIQPQPLYRGEAPRGGRGGRGGRGASRGGFDSRPPRSAPGTTTSQRRETAAPVFSDQDFPTLGK